MTLKRKYCIKYTRYFIQVSSYILCFTLISLPKIIALWLFLLSLPFNFKDQLRALHCSSAPQAKKNVSQNCLFCQAPFAFFYFYFFKFSHVSQPKAKLKNKDISVTLIRLHAGICKTATSCHSQRTPALMRLCNILIYGRNR